MSEDRFAAPGKIDSMTPRRRKLIKRLAKREGGLRCYMCQVELTMETVTIDHVLPKALGGTDEDHNLKLACQPCNNAKSDALPDGKGGWKPKQVGRVVVQRVPRPELCNTCDAGRKLSEEESCAKCGSGPMPPRRPRYLKMHPLDCDHDLFWCSHCCLWMDAERVS